MGIVWAVLTGRDRELGPPLGWWRGPAWLGWALLVAVLSWWSVNSFLVWTSAAMGNAVIAALLVVVQASPLLLTRYRPLTAVRVAAVATILAALIAKPIPRPIGVVHAWPLDAYLLPLAPVLALAIARSPKPRGVAILAGAALSFAALVVGVRFGVSLMAGPLTGLIVAVIAGYVLNDSRTVKLESEQERQKRSQLEERARIARDLHDVIGHHLSMIAVRTDSAQYRISGVTPEVQDEFAALGSAAREALTEARRLIGVLREDDAEAERWPQPSIDDIPALVRSAVSSGASVELSVEPMPEVPAMVGLVAYRIVQESLSNAMRHSPGAPVEVRLRPSGDDIELRVDNGPSEHKPSPGRGSGLAGIGERVRLIGGRSAAARRSDGGFRVWARLPVGSTP